MELKADWATFPKHYSTWLIAATVLFDGLYIFTGEMKTLLSPQTVVLINGLAAVGTKFLTLLKQAIPVAPEVKDDMKETLKALPTKAPSGAVVPPPIPATHRVTQDELDHMMDRRILKHEELKARKPRKRRTPTAKIAAQFNPPGEVK